MRPPVKLAFTSFQFRNSLYTDNVLYVESCFRSFAYTFTSTLYNYSSTSDLEKIFSNAHSNIPAKFH